MCSAASSTWKKLNSALIRRQNVELYIVRGSLLLFSVCGVATEEQHNSATNNECGANIPI
jgi:hypothetical protein